MNLDNPAADMSGLGIPGNVIADFESFSHLILPNAQLRYPVQQIAALTGGAGREVVAAFDAGAITSDAGALLLGATDRAVRMMDRFASCFHDERRADLIEHEVATLVGQRVFGIALGYEDLNDHDELRHDPLMAVLAGKFEARREDCAPVAGKSTLNRLELSRLEPTRYHKISHNPMAINRLLVDLFLEAHERAPNGDHP